MHPARQQAGGSSIHVGYNLIQPPTIQTLGLTVLDEPSATQSDPSVLELQLRVVTKQSASKTARIKKVKASEDNTAVEKWIRDISDLHRSKPPPSVHYQKTMPDIDNLMQVRSCIKPEHSNHTCYPGVARRF